MTDVRTGSLLLATRELQDPHFVGTVILILDVAASGALGVVLNRPTELPVAAVLEPWAGAVVAPDVLFSGGPVEKDGALALALRESDPTGPDAETTGLRPVVDRLVLIDLDTPVEQLADELAALRIFAGYAGWGSGQLDREIAEGSWYVVAGIASDVFRPDTSTLWADVLRRQPGDLAMHATRPVDPERN